MKYYITNDLISHNEMLGSQTFNYFCLYAISKQTGHEVAISSAPHRHQGLILECFDTPFSLFPNNIAYKIHNSKLCGMPVVENDLFNIDPNCNYVINARFDYSSVYWKNLLPELKATFKIKPQYLKEAQGIINNINEPIACLNFRRGIYSFYMDSYMNYYKNALEQIPKNTTLMLMSDDFEWVNTSLELKQLIKGRKVIRANFTNYVQLAIISLCDYNVCCPSSFCFIGSILSEKPHVTMFPYLHNTELFNMCGGFQFTVDDALTDWLQIKF